jgi:thiol-disulfide isomerase/thioredoxin
MKISFRGFVFGLLVGVALAMVTLELLGRYFDRAVSSGAQVHLLRALPPEPRWPAGARSLPHPVFPETGTDTAADWQVRAIDGSSVIHLSDLKGKATFINYWGTSCGPCIAEMPSIERLYASMRRENVRILTVTQDKEDQVRRFLEKKPLKLPIYLAGERLPPPHAFGLPTTYILDSSGYVAYMHVGALDWDDDRTRRFLHDLSQTRD